MLKGSRGFSSADPAGFAKWSGQLPPPPECPGGFIYTVQRGDSFFRISRRFGVSLQDLIDANPQVRNPNTIVPGQQLCIPEAVAPPCPEGFVHTVEQGETMAEIARRFGITLQDLINANPQITDPNEIFPGQKICVPRGVVVPPPPVCEDGFIYTVQRGETLSGIARRFGTTVQAILAANPQITNPNVIFPGQRICIPLPPPPVCEDGFIYTVQRGETLTEIARRFGTTVQAILAANPQITDPNVIFAGQRICIPVAPTPECPNGFIYTVQSGDTMFLIAQRFGVSLNALIAANPQIPDPNLIFPGQRICVPREVPPVPPPPPPCPEGFIYTVQRGDTLFLIAQRFGVSLSALIAANPQITDPNVIVPGQRICVPFPPPPECEEGFIYTVQEGDTLFMIAQRFGTTVQAILAANPQIVDPNLIFPGQKICIPGPVGLCPVILTGTMRVMEAVGAAFVNLAGGTVMAAGFRLPDPGDFDPGATTYVVWITDGDMRPPFRFQLQQTTVAGIWVGSAEAGFSLAGFDTIIVTAEPEPIPTRPTGLTALTGSLAYCN